VDVPESPRESAKINETKHTIVSRPVKKDIKKNRSQTEFSLDSAILRVYSRAPIANVLARNT